jgi:hypothetical protein
VLAVEALEWSPAPMKPPTPPAISARITPDATRIQDLARDGCRGAPFIVPPVPAWP